MRVQLLLLLLAAIGCAHHDPPFWSYDRGDGIEVTWESFTGDLGDAHGLRLADLQGHARQASPDATDLDLEAHIAQCSGSEACDFLVRAHASADLLDSSLVAGEFFLDDRRLSVELDAGPYWDRQSYALADRADLRVLDSDDPESRLLQLGMRFGDRVAIGQVRVPVRDAPRSGEPRVILRSLRGSLGDQLDLSLRDVPLGIRDWTQLVLATTELGHNLTFYFDVRGIAGWMDSSAPSGPLDPRSLDISGMSQGDPGLPSFQWWNDGESRVTALSLEAGTHSHTLHFAATFDEQHGTGTGDVEGDIEVIFPQ